MGSTDVVSLVLLFTLLSMNPHASAFFSSCLAPSELLELHNFETTGMQTNLHAFSMSQECVLMLPPHGALEDYRTYTGQIRLATTWIFASRAMRRNGSLSTGYSFAEKEKKRKKKEESLPPSDRRLRWEPPCQMLVSEVPDCQR